MIINDISKEFCKFHKIDKGPVVIDFCEHVNDDYYNRILLIVSILSDIADNSKGKYELWYFTSNNWRVNNKLQQFKGYWWSLKKYYKSVDIPVITLEYNKQTYNRVEYSGAIKLIQDISIKDIIFGDITSTYFSMMNAHFVVLPKDIDINNIKKLLRLGFKDQAGHFLNIDKNLFDFYINNDCIITQCYDYSAVTDPYQTGFFLMGNKSIFKNLKNIIDDCELKIEELNI